MITYKGKEFSSMLQLSKYLNESDSTLLRYYKASTSQEEFEEKVEKLVITRREKQGALYLVNSMEDTNFTSTTKAYKYLVDKYDLRTSFLIKPNGLKEYEYIKLLYKLRGTDLYWILEKDKKPIKYKGQTFNSLHEFLSFYKVTVPKFIRAFYNNGCNLEKTLKDAYEDDYREVYKPVIKGVHYENTEDMANRLGISSVLFKRLVRTGMTDDEAFEYMKYENTLQNRYFPLKTTIGVFNTLLELMNYFNISISKVRTMLTNNTVERNIELKQQGFDVNLYIDRQMSDVFPYNYRGTWIPSGKSFIEYFKLDGRKEDFYKEVFKTQRNLDNYVKELGKVEVIWNNKSHYTLKSLAEEMQKQYKVHYAILYIVWGYLSKLESDRYEKQRYLQKRLQSILLQSSMMTIDGKTYSTINEIADNFKVSKTTIKKYLKESKTKEDFIKRIKG